MTMNIIRFHFADGCKSEMPTTCNSIQTWVCTTEAKDIFRVGGGITNERNYYPAHSIIRAEHVIIETVEVEPHVVG